MDTEVELDYWRFVDFAVEHAAGTLGPDIDVRAMQLMMTLNRATDLMAYDVRSAVTSRPFSPAGHRLLWVLDLTGPLEMSSLAEITGMSRAAVSAAFRTLESTGMVERRRSENDGRSVIMALTDTGRAASRKAFTEQHQREREWVQALSEKDLNELVRILSLLIEHGMTFARRREPTEARVLVEGP